MEILKVTMAWIPCCYPWLGSIVFSLGIGERQGILTSDTSQSQTNAIHQEEIRTSTNSNGS